MNLGHLLANSAANHPQARALSAAGQGMTYAELAERVSRLAGSLAGLGLHPGDRLGILFFNGIPLVETYFAALWLGLVAVPVNFRLTAREMAFILNDSGCRALVHGPEFSETLAQALPQLATVERFICPGGQGPDPFLAYEDLLTGEDQRTPNPLITEDSPCQIMYTSGTTGRPKGAVITHRSVLWNLFNTMHGREDRAGQVSIIVGPMYHTAALNNHLSIQVALGGTSVLVKKFEPEELLATVQREKATVISGSPAMYLLLMQHPRAASYDTTSIRKCTAGADKLPMEVKHRLMEFFPHIKGVYDVYGCTEASPTITVLGAEDSLRKDGSVGRPVPFLQARVVDELGRPVPAGGVGEIICQGPNVMQGYHNDPQGTAAAIREGWLHTGDLARVDDEGFFYIVDRKKDMVVSGGENIYPREVEEVLYTHPGVSDAAVVGVPDQLWGEQVVAFVAPRDGAMLDEAGIIDFCKEQLASYKKPRRVIVVDEIPRNASGKALKYQLRRDIMEQGAGEGEG